MAHHLAPLMLQIAGNSHECSHQLPDAQHELHLCLLIHWANLLRMVSSSRHRYQRGA